MRELMLAITCLVFGFGLGIQFAVEYYKTKMIAKGEPKMSKNWTYTCPICKKQIVEDYSEDSVKEYIGATHDCPNCNGLLMINEDLSVKDFGAELVNSYKELGIDVTKEEATSSYISFNEQEAEITEESLLIKTYVNLGLTEEQAKHIIEVSKKELDDDV